MTEHVPATAGAEADARRRQRREGNTLLAAMLTNGPNELIDFVLPLWAGAAIGLSATEVGVLLAVEMVLSMVFRPVSGVLADTFERRYVARREPPSTASRRSATPSRRTPQSPTRRPPSAAWEARCCG